MPRVLMPLPDADFDTTEVAVPWRLLTEAGVEVVFATETGAVAACDPRLLTGVLFGQLGAEPEPKAFYVQMLAAPSFQDPLSWDFDPADFDALWLPGGHAPGMRQYLGHEGLAAKVAAFWVLGRPVAAICHGVLVLARSLDPATGRSVLHGRTTTCLPRYMELVAWGLTGWKLGRYYRTYDLTVQEEVEAALGPEGRFERGPIHLVSRGTRSNDGPAFVVEDGPYLSARWPGDAYALSRALLTRLQSVPQ